MIESISASLLAVTPEAAATLQFVFLAVWVFVFGSCIGSFLNVVAWRTPRGMSLVKPDSHCPRCEHPIRWYDNIPIIGWIQLRGKCRDCGLKISRRYPIIELFAGLMFLTLYLFAIPNLPIIINPDLFPIQRDIESLVAIYMIYAALCSTLLVAAVIEFDSVATESKQREKSDKSSCKKSNESSEKPVRVPARIFITPITVGLLLSIFQSNVTPMRAITSIGNVTPLWLTLTAGLIAGIIFSLATRQLGQRESWPGRAMAVVAVGVCLGWQAVCVVTIVSSVLYLVFRYPTQRRMTFLIWLLLSTVLLLCIWQPILTSVTSLYE